MLTEPAHTGQTIIECLNLHHAVLPVLAQILEFLQQRIELAARDLMMMVVVMMMMIACMLVCGEEYFGTHHARVEK
jgi:membrane protein insertase Oxa1/YidC/SpoIIIJ